MSNICKSRIDGEFRGWEGESIYKLQNGQIWQLSRYYYYYYYMYCPEVTITQISDRYMMHVEGCPHDMEVTRIN